jgi:hypothetical protein
MEHLKSKIKRIDESDVRIENFQKILDVICKEHIEPVVGWVNGSSYHSQITVNQNDYSKFILTQIEREHDESAADREFINAIELLAEQTITK